MHTTESFLPPPVPGTWALTDDQRNLYTACRRFARDRLEPLLAEPSSAAAWQETVRLAAAALDLGAMVLPEDLGGMAIDRHDLTLVVEALAAGPLERAAELTLTAPALMTLREHDALAPLLAHPIREYFDGTRAIALSVPDIETATAWRLRPLDGTSVLTLQIDDTQHLLLTKQVCNPQSTHLIALGSLILERLSFDEAVVEPPLAMIEQRDCDRILPAQTYMTETGLYLSALLTGAMQHSIRFGLDYATTRPAFRKPLASHQIVATRLSDMLIATHGAHLFVQSVATARPFAPVSLVRQLIRHVATESVNVSRELVQLCGGHGYVDGLPPAARFQTSHWFSLLLLRIDAALEWFTDAHLKKQAEVQV